MARRRKSRTLSQAFIGYFFIALNYWAIYLVIKSIYQFVKSNV